MQKKIPPPTLHEDDLTQSVQIVDEREYRALVQRVQALRTDLQTLARPEDFDPWHFFAVFDRVHLKSGYVPDFTFTPIHFPFGPASTTERPAGVFTLTTRLARRPPRSTGPMGRFLAYFLPHRAIGARVILPKKPGLDQPWNRPALRLLLPQGLKGLIFEQTASGCLQFAVFGLEALRWHRHRQTDWPYEPDWNWVCSREELEVLVPALHDSTPPARDPFSLRPEHWQWLRNVDPQLRVRIREGLAQVGGLAYSIKAGFAWLDCELIWPNRFRISRLEELGFGRNYLIPNIIF